MTLFGALFTTPETLGHQGDIFGTNQEFNTNKWLN
jgi:hypothetical protein